MENLFDRVDFEPGMYFLADVLSDWIENNKCGFANVKNENFSVKFVFRGMKTGLGYGTFERELVEGQSGDLKRMRKLNGSMEALNFENLPENINIDQNEKLDVATKFENNKASGSGVRGRKRKGVEAVVSGGQTQSKKNKKK